MVRADTFAGSHDGGARESERRVELRARLATIAPFDVQLTVPDLRPGMVPRPGLVARLTAADAPPVVVVSAPTGYGKTTLLAEWAASDPRPFAWVSVTPTENSALVLVSYVARALDGIEPLDEALLAALTRRDADLTTELLPRLGAALQHRTTPVVLVLDDVHLLEDPSCAKVLSTLVEHVPAGSQVALAGRVHPVIGWSRLRARGRLLHLRIDDLSMSRTEGGALVSAAGVELAAGALSALVDRADGWPAGLYLATIAVRGGRDPDEAARAFRGDDRVVAELLRDELLATLPPETVQFLVRTSILERLSGPLCDAVLGRRGSARLLDGIARSNLFVIPLDRHDEWYRYHHLFRDVLRAELRRSEPELEPDLHLRASAWFESHGEFDAAIRHAHAAGDTDRTTEYVATGRSAVLEQWLRLFTPETIASSPELALTAAWRALTSRDIDSAHHWIDAAASAPTDFTLADGRRAHGVVALLRAGDGRDGLTRMRVDATTALALIPAPSPFRAAAWLFEGIALRLLGDPDGARERLEQSMREAGAFVPAARTNALAQLALLALDHDDWSPAEACIEQARRLAGEYDMREQPALAMVYALSALAEARRGIADLARREVNLARSLLAFSGGAAPWLGTECRLVLARAALLLGDVAAARLLLEEADACLGHVADMGSLPDRVEHARKSLHDVDLTAGVIAAPLTAAELRVLRYLPTHLTLAAIADELFVSRNTAKTHAIAVYRKLGVSSRQDAVQHARELGLLDDSL